ncbi:DNA polymerase III subunit beta [Desulfovibrio sp. OttesenSCG-928-A18]|nr:DNA polymerase III subunit beta [Desulfovibrio sp. OttesenSCG-928-A18]
MYLTVFKEEIIEGLQKAANIIPQRTGAAYLRSIWLKAEKGRLEILSTDSNIEFRGSYTADVTQEGLAGVQGRSFVELLRRLPSGKITLKVDAEAPVLHINSEGGRGKYKFPVNDATWFQSFADFPEQGAVTWSGDFLQELIDRISYCIGDDGSDALSCLFMKGVGGESSGSIEAAGMNGHQFAMCSFSNDDLHALLPPEGILVQKKYLNELKKWLGNDEIQVNIGDRRLFVRTENKAESFSLPLSSYQYPDYGIFLSRLSGDAVSSLVLNREETQSALMRIAIFNSDSNRCTYFDLSEKEAVLSATGQEVGSASESLDVEYSGDIEKIAFPTSNLLTIMDHYASGSLSFTLTGAEGPCGIRGADDPEYLVIIMPMKILDDVNFSEEQV